jgi:glycerol uptake facilitator-like aquaporin
VKKCWFVKKVCIGKTDERQYLYSVDCRIFSTFFVVLVGGSAVALATGGSTVGSALAFGLITAMVIYVLGKYSGAHANPAVSLGFALTGRMGWGRMIGYWVAQILGGIAAAGLLVYFFGTDQGGASEGSPTLILGRPSLSKVSLPCSLFSAISSCTRKPTCPPFLVSRSV